MEKSEMPYQKISHCVLFNLLKNAEISSALAYMIDGQSHAIQEVIPHANSIELSGSTVSISIVLFVDFVAEEYAGYASRPNHHVVTLSHAALQMHEYKDIPLRFIDKHALVNFIIAMTENDFGKKLRNLQYL